MTLQRRDLPSRLQGSWIRHTLMAGAVALAAIGVTASTFADSVVLSDGRVLKGTITHEGKMLVISSPDGEGKPVRVDARDVVAINMTTPQTPQDASHAEWTRTAALIRRSNDLKDVIQLHEKYLEKFPSEELSAQVRLSLGEYQKLLAQNGVKFMGRWMPAAQVDTTVRQWQSDAHEAEALYRGGRVRQALDAAQRALRTDDENPYALMLAGLSAYRLSEYQSSRDFFQSLATLDSGSVLAENNLGVIYALINQPSESLAHYARAIQAAPQNRMVADNVKEALYAYPKDRSNGVVQNLARPFSEAESRLETNLAAQGLFRYGATWVSQPQRDRLQTNRKIIQTAMVQLQSQYDQAIQAHATIDQQLTAIGSSRYSTASDLDYLNWIILNYGASPDIFNQRNTLQAEIDRLDAQRAALLAQKDSTVGIDSRFATESQKFQRALAQLDAVGFTGVQRIMDLGEDVTPPAPAVIETPALPVPGPLLVSTPTIAPPSAPVQTALADGYRQWSTPVGIPLIPIIIWNDGGGHDGDHHHHHPTSGDGDDGNGSTPTTPTNPVNPGTPVTTPVGSTGSRPVHLSPVGIRLGGFGGFRPIRTPNADAPVTSVPAPTPVVAPIPVVVQPISGGVRSPGGFGPAGGSRSAPTGGSGGTRSPVNQQ